MMPKTVILYQVISSYKKLRYLPYMIHYLPHRFHYLPLYSKYSKGNHLPKKKLHFPFVKGFIFVFDETTHSLEKKVVNITHWKLKMNWNPKPEFLQNSLFVLGNSQTSSSYIHICIICILTHSLLTILLIGFVSL